MEIIVFVVAELVKMKVFVVLFTVVAFARSQEQQKMTFETPNLSEEEQHSQHTPKSFEIQCDACTVIAYKVGFALHGTPSPELC